MRPASRSAPFLYTSLLTTTTVTGGREGGREGGRDMSAVLCGCTPLSGWLWEGSGVKQTESTAFGMTETVSGLRTALKTVFSLLPRREESGTSVLDTV